MAKYSKRKESTPVPKKMELVDSVYKAFKCLSKPLSIDELYQWVITDMNISDEILGYLQINKEPETELHYNVKWTVTDIGKAKILFHDHHNKWSLAPIYKNFDVLDDKDKDRVYHVKQKKQQECQLDVSFGVNLKGILKLKDISYIQLADMTNIPFNTVESWVSINESMSARDMQKVCKALNISPYYIITGDTEKYGDMSNIDELLTNFNHLSDKSKELIRQLIQVLP